MKQNNTEAPNTQTNVDRDEIAKFEELAHRWWDTESEFKPLHAINPLRANFIDRLSPVAEKKVIDSLANFISNKGKNSVDFYHKKLGKIMWDKC